MGRKIRNTLEFKQRIISTAESMGFTLESDTFEEKEKGGYGLRYLRFEPTVEAVRSRDLVWVWYKRDSIRQNLSIGNQVRKRMLERLNRLK